MLTSIALNAFETLGLLGTVLMLVLTAFVVYGFHPIERWRYRHIPGPPARWMIGVLPELVTMSMHEAYDMWALKYAEHGVFKVFLGGAMHVVIVEPLLATKMLASSPDRFIPIVASSDADKLWLENDMLTLNGAAFKERRTSFNQFLLSTTKLEAYFPAMLRSTDRLVDHMATLASASADSIDLWPLFGRLTLDVILTIASGIEINTLDEIVSSDHGTAGTYEESFGTRLARTIRADLDSFSIEAGMAMRYIFPEMKQLAEVVNQVTLSEKGKKGAEARKEMRDIFYALIDAARHDTSMKQDSKLRINLESFIAAVASAKDADTGELKPKIWSAVQTFLFTAAGYETTAIMLAITVHLLAKNPDKQDRAIAEVDAFGRTRTPTFADLEQLPYLHACLMESLRLYPPGALTVRLSKTDMMLGPYHVPKGTRMHNVSWSTHRMPQYWERSLEFLPERWLDETNGAPRADPKAHLPFGGGARKCPGSRLALQEAQLALLRLYQRFKFGMPQDGSSELKLRLGITLAPVGSGVPAMIIAR